MRLRPLGEGRAVERGAVDEPDEVAARGGLVTAFAAVRARLAHAAVVIGAGAFFLLAILSSRLLLGEAFKATEISGIVLIGSGLALLSLLGWMASRRRPSGAGLTPTAAREPHA